MSLAKNLWKKLTQNLSWALSSVPLRSLWEIWALANILIILILVTEAIWFPELNNKLSHFFLDMYLPKPASC